MANLKELAVWENAIYQIEKLDPVVGGADGVTNRPLLQLANRTFWLKQQTEFTQNTARPLAINASSANTIDSTGHSHLISQASTTQKGIVQLNDTLTSNSNTDALTARQGKVLDDKISRKLESDANAVSSSKLATPRTIALTGDVSGQTRFDGSANVGIGVTLANSGVQAGTYQSVTVDAKGRVTNGQTILNSLITATTATGTANQATGNTNTYLNLVTHIGTNTQSQGSSTKITGTNGISVSSDTAGALTITGTRASDTAIGVTQLSHNTNGTDKTKAASEFALGEVRRMANQAQVTADGIALTWNNVQNKPSTFTPSAHRHNWSEIDRVPVASTTTQGITQLNDSLTSTANNQALTANQGKILNDKINELDGNKMPLKGRLSQNLNMLNADYTGIWQQSQNAQAHTSLNYPVQKAGTLWVLPSAYTGQQLYLPWDGSVLYTRNTTNSGSWSDWRAIGEVQDVLNSDSRSAGLSARQGKILDEKLTELDGQAVKTTGNQNIVGIKQYASVQKATAGLEFAANKENFDAGRYGVLGANANSAYIKNNQTNKLLELRHNGQLTYDSQKVWLYNDKSDAVNLDDTDKIATAKAVKTLNDAKLGKNDNAVSASKLATARNIAMTGDGVWNVNFDGSQNATGAFTLTNTGVTAGSYNSVTVDAKGRVTAGLTQTHGLVTATTATGTANTATTNSNTFLNIVSSALSGTNSVGSSTQITGVNGISVSSDTKGKLIVTRDSNSPTATKLQTARTINGVAFDGSQNITIADDTKAPVSHRHRWNEIDGIPANLATTDSNVASASKLQTARNIALTGAVTGSASFDGSQGVSISTALNLSNNMAILTGVSRHGEILPIPDGFLIRHCHFFVSMRESNVDSITWDIPEHGFAQHLNMQCYVSGRTVFAKVTVANDNGRGGVGYHKEIPASVNYMVIAFK